MQTQLLSRDMPHPVPIGSLEIVGAAAKACDLFFARTERAGTPTDQDRRSFANGFLGITSIESQRGISLRPASPGNLQMIVAGWVYRAHILPNGARQITDILLPGDFLPQAEAGLDTGEQEVCTCGPVQLAVLRREVVTGSAFPSLRRHWELLGEAQAHRLRARLVSLGRRDARERILQFLAEQHQRLCQVGLADSHSFSWPFTQEQLADMLGLTSVHVNRVLQRLRGDGLLWCRNGQVVIPVPARLHTLAGNFGRLAKERAERSL